MQGPTAGAVLVEWNVHEGLQGSVAMWDCHFRVGGAIGSNLQQSDCSKLSGGVKPKCKAASMLMHVTSSASGYFENIWAWNEFTTETSAWLALATEDQAIGDDWGSVGESVDDNGNPSTVH
ncbi:hypothetical protein BO70DRAFT_393487 [Aspergillus heteromorphus CBS 117.55]|uniref:Uncharacterized protein n=1 Tax=Aspergillus heteromorphus CBS 117.55 TaxID=1448321 RepID=A0A317WUT9_9EURO|nr:uncharacterized protein BO70DRAFT_393487 [Aspergillus heteromorphus CBS 117.55]PWY88967.1 hypothetical protein BO70DRAFT_393487 [Aspergillus heteromorphus CBS 117.55]